MTGVQPPTAYAALLRGVNVGGGRIRMAPLRQVVEALGHADVATLRTSGNVVLRATGHDEASLAAGLAAAIADEVGRDVPVVVRDRSHLRATLATEPFGDEADPKLVHLVLLDGPTPSGSERAVSERADRGERIVGGHDHLWIWYRNGSARSKLTLDVIERCTGRTGTARNLNTVRDLAAMLDERCDPDPDAGSSRRA